jgi:hypothetical protein
MFFFYMLPPNKKTCFGRVVCSSISLVLFVTAGSAVLGGDSGPLSTNFPNGLVASGDA